MLGFTKNETVQGSKLKTTMFGHPNIKTLVPFLGCLLSALLFIGLTKGDILKSSNLQVIFNQVFTMIMIGSGAIFVYAYGGIDFSIGSVMGLASFVIAIMTRSGYPMAFTLLVAIVMSVFCQMVVGFTAATLRIPLIIISLSFNYIFIGILRAAISSLNSTLYIPPQVSAIWANGNVRLAGLFIIVGVMLFIYTKTRFGKYSKAIGGNETAVHLCGVNVTRQKVLSHVFLGISIGVAALFAVTRAGVATASSGGTGVSLFVMEALILGGVPINGGKDSRFSAVILGSFIIAILQNGFLLIGANKYAIEGITGVLFIIVVTLTLKRVKGIIVT